MKYYNQDYSTGIRIKQEIYKKNNREHRNRPKFCGHLIFNKSAKATQQAKKGVFFNQMVLKTSKYPDEKKKLSLNP